MSLKVNKKLNKSHYFLKNKVLHYHLGIKLTLRNILVIKSFAGYITPLTTRIVVK